MDFGNKYLTYEEYLELGGTIKSVSPFELLEFNARSEIDLRTHNRLVGVDEIPLKVKICMFHLIEMINSYATNTETAPSNIASENIDGYSISYLSPTQVKEIITTKRTEIDDIMLTYMYGVIVNNEAILYNGVE